MSHPARLFSLTVLFMSAMALMPSASRAEIPTYDIPLLTNLSIDGKSDDWGDRGFRAEVMNQRSFDGVTPENFNPRCRLAWTNQGLAVLFVVREREDNISIRHVPGFLEGNKVCHDVCHFAFHITCSTTVKESILFGECEGVDGPVLAARFDNIEVCKK